MSAGSRKTDLNSDLVMSVEGLISAIMHGIQLRKYVILTLKANK